MIKTLLPVPSLVMPWMLMMVLRVGTLGIMFNLDQSHYALVHVF